MNQETKDIKIPIKSIVEDAVLKNGAKYEEEEFNLLRKYFIACLNLGYLKPSDLVLMVNKFVSKIKFIVLNYNNINKMDYYMINGSVLYISGSLKDNNFPFYQITFYKAVTEVIFNANDNHIAFSNAICEITAEKIYNMDVNSSRIIMPNKTEEQIGKDKIKISAGYTNYNLIISLLKQLFISKDINENILIRNMFFNSYDEVLNSNFKGENDELLLNVLDKICIMYIKRKVLKEEDPNEKNLLDKYQIIVNDMFKTIDQNYFAFLALVTSDELRQKCVSKLEKTGDNNE